MAWAAALVMAAVPALAQSPVYLALPAPDGCAPNCATQLLRVDADRPAVTAAWILPVTVYESLFPRAIKVEYVTPDGGTVVWLEPRPASRNIAPSTLGLLDIRRGTVQVGAVSATASAIVGHPRRPEIYLSQATGPVALGPGGANPLSGPSCASGASQALVASGDGRRVLFSCTQTPAFGDVFVIDTDSRTSVGSRSIEAIVPALSPDGRDLYAVEGGQLRRYAVEGGPVLAETPLPTIVAGRPESILTLQVHPRTGRVFAFGVGVHVFEAATLQPVRSGVGVWANTASGGLGTWTFDPERPRAYVTTYASDGSGARTHAYWAIETEQLSTVWVHETPQSLAAGPGRFVIAPLPASPVSLTSSVAASSVTLTWASGVSNATVLRHVLEAGSAPGLNDVIAGLELGPQTSFAASSVPPGRYYVRVRAGNHTGVSAPSNEIVVQVP